MALKTLIQRIQIKYFMVYYLGFFLLFSSFYAASLEILWKGLALVAFYCLFDLLWTRVKKRIWYLPISSVISGLVIALVAVPAPSMLLLVLLPLLAVTSKQLLKFGKKLHVFNPAAFAMGVLALFVPAISWWGVAWGRAPMLLAIMVGIFILWRQNRFHVTLSFLAAYSFFLGLLFLYNGVPILRLPDFLWPQLFDGTVVFFATVMLVEPITSAFPTRENRIWYGALVGLFAVLISWIGGYLRLQDPLIYGLLLGNFLCSMLWQKNK